MSSRSLLGQSICRNFAKSSGSSDQGPIAPLYVGIRQEDMNVQLCDKFCGSRELMLCLNTPSPKKLERSYQLEHIGKVPTCLTTPSNAGRLPLVASWTVRPTNNGTCWFCVVALLLSKTKNITQHCTHLTFTWVASECNFKGCLMARRLQASVSFRFAPPFESEKPKYLG